MAITPVVTSDDFGSYYHDSATGRPLRYNSGTGEYEFADKPLPTLNPKWANLQNQVRSVYGDPKTTPPIFDLGNNTGWGIEWSIDPAEIAARNAAVADPAGFSGSQWAPTQGYTPTIQNAYFIPDMAQAIKDADNGGFLADYGWMLPLGIASGGAMLGGLGGATGAEGLYGLELGGEGVGAAVGGSEAAGSGGLSWLGNEGLATIPDATSASSGGMFGVYNPGEIMNSAITSSSYNPSAIMDAATAASAAGLGNSPSIIPGLTNAQLVSGGMSVLGGLLAGNANQNAAQTNANAQLDAARIAAEAARFKPVGVTTNFGQSKFTTDAQGNVTGAGYTLSPQLQALQNQLMGAAPGMLSQFTGSQATTAPMGTAAQRAMSLGNQYLATDPLAQAQKYYNDQQAVMATQRERDLVNLENRLAAQGRLGLAIGGTSTGMMAANPEMEALRNAQKQQDLQLAAAATQGGMDYAKFGTAMTGAGGDLLKSMYGTQTAAFSPYQTALGGAQTIEGLGQNALDLSVNLGKTASPAQSGQLLAQGMMNAGNINQAAAYSPWGTALMSAGNALQGWQAQNQQQQQQQQFANMFANALNKPSSFVDGSYGGTWY